MFLRRWVNTFIAAGILLAAPVAAQPSDFLVSTEWLEKNLSDPKLRVVEVSVNPGLFERGHIPGSANFNWHTDLVDTVSRDIASAPKFEALLRNAGINQDTVTVLYGDNNNWFAAWGAWLFDIYGVQNVKLLDGGRKKWEAEGRPLSNRSKVHAPGNVQVKAADTTLRAHLSDVLAVARKEKDAVLVDIRSADEYNGKIFAPNGVPELAVRAGHVPGAVNVSWGKLVAEDGTFKPVEELKTIYQSVGVDGSKPIITYCRIGERSSHSWFALRKLLGYDVRNYDGSWTEYGNSVGAPISNPSGTVWGKT
ncbi:sulfurtransferase [Bordetella avium]|uniref:Sulfurtransferase n=1 Tax=Bordetella avium (strain 197N) TaxID=360910 RepID=Q2L0R2_BORA1|nr:sulfurtransferase [Bordetella avium]AZY52550.1 sulfurtransferase [Bordetella avium]RIQ48601.1 sulfurtransferase [Bordetella avium]RIQ71355.1 sulfurtransferase [Bordetella avium]CAJ49450.1 putative thiosulfate sulfurtransferase [Bordetella avium 197N]